MRSCLRALTSALVLVCAQPADGFGASSGNQADKKDQTEFEALVARVKQSDPSVDFMRLRRLYAESDRYVPYRDDAEAAMIEAAEAVRHEQAPTIAREILARDYTNIEAHFVATVSCSELKDAPCAAHHAYVARGMIQSILASGDGKTPANRFVSVTRSPGDALHLGE